MRWMAVLGLLFGLSASLAAGTNYFELDAVSFKAAAGQAVRSEGINEDLMAAAIWRETNERRREHGLAALKYNAKATEAAKIQSDIMRARGAISHVNPESPKYRTLELRVKSVGLNYRLIAENVATAFGIRYESG